MNSESVHLIATDPPFNKGRDFHATPDSLADGASFQDRWSWEKDVHQEWIDKLQDDFPKVYNVIQGSRNSYGDDMGAFLCFMAVRLEEMRRVLRDDGSIYLHCDPTASHYLKELMDAIFGRKNFRNEIIWSYRTGGSSNKHFSKKHDVILWYTKSAKKWFFHPLKEKSYTKSKNRLPGIINYGAGTAEFHKDENGVYNWVNMRDVWEISYINSQAKERIGYPTQKPLDLYERIIKASSNEGDIVLDPFAGCATTLVAAERLGRQWVGIDIWDKAYEVVIDRLEKEGLIQKQNRKTKEKIELSLYAKDLHFSSEIPNRTDEGEEAIPFLRTKLNFDEPKGEKMSRGEMFESLLGKYGSKFKCQGCDREFDDRRYLELDHNRPRSDGGWNHISNRILLCGPCNKLKSNKFTLSGLRSENKKLGYMAS